MTTEPSSQAWQGQEQMDAAHSAGSWAGDSQFQAHDKDGYSESSSVQHRPKGNRTRSAPYVHVHFNASPYQQKGHHEKREANTGTDGQLTQESTPQTSFQGKGIFLLTHPSELPPFEKLIV